MAKRAAMSTMPATKSIKNSIHNGQKIFCRNHQNMGTLHDALCFYEVFCVIFSWPVAFFYRESESFPHLPPPFAVRDASFAEYLTAGVLPASTLFPYTYVRKSRRSLSAECSSSLQTTIMKY
jgi:hypothetical protein